MARLVVSDRPKPGLQIAEPRTRRRIIPRKSKRPWARSVPAPCRPAARRCRPTRCGRSSRRLRSTGGRPALADADVRPKIPMRQSQWKKLEILARRIESDGFHPTPAQLGSVILDAAIDQLERALDAAGNNRTT